MIAQLNDIAQVWWQWMAGMFWQVSLFIILVTLLDMAIRRWAWPQVRYVLWGLVFIKLIIPPTWQMPTSIVSWIQPKVEEQISVQITSGQITSANISSPVQVTMPVITNEKPTGKAMVLLTWLAGMTAFGLMLTIKMSRLPRRSTKQHNQDAPEWFHELLIKTAQRLKLRKTPIVIFSNYAKSPAVYGIFKPVLLLPEGCLDHLSEEQAEHVLIHELYHLKRGDVLIHWICLVIQVIYWFNPLLIWTRRQMRHVCEICCDLSVADILREKTIAYRDTLLATARNLLTESVEPSLGLLGIFEEPFRLVSRLKWLEKKTWGNRKQKIAATICTSLIMILCVMPMAGISQTNSKNNNSEIQSDNHVKADGQGTRDKDNALKPQFLIEVVVAEIGKEADIDLGIEVHEVKDLDLGAERYGRPSGSQEDEGRSIPDLPFKGELSNSISPAPLSFGPLGDDITIGGKSFTDIKAAIEAMKTEPGIHVIATPKLVAQDNTKATIETGPILELPFVNESPQEWGGKLSLEITPQIQEDGYILQQIDLAISQSIEGDPNRKVTKNIDTKVVVRDGQTVVIGSILTSGDTVDDENSSNKKELIMFLTSHIIKPPRQQNRDENSTSTSQAITRYDALIIEVDADKELELDAEPIGPSTGSQTEDENYVVQGVYNPGTQPYEGDHYNIERVEVLREPQGTLGLGLPDLPPTAYVYASARGAGTTESFLSLFSVCMFQDVISIGGESFPDIEAVFENVKTEAGVNILGTPQTITLDDKGIKTPWNMEYNKTSTVLLGIKSDVTRGGGVQKLVSLSISPPNDEKSREGQLMTLAASLTLIEDGGAMVMICDPRILADSMNEEHTESGKMLYVFLAPHVENP